MARAFGYWYDPILAAKSHVISTKNCTDKNAGNVS